jgi:hypothetical protein
VLTFGAEALALRREFELAALCETTALQGGNQFLGNAALEEHEHSLASIGEHLDADALETVRAHVVATPHEQLLAEILTRLDALDDAEPRP